MISNSLDSVTLDGCRKSKKSNVSKKETRTKERKAIAQVMAILCTVAGLFGSSEPAKTSKPSSRQRSQKKKHWQKKRIGAHDDKGVHLNTPHPAEGFFAGGDESEHIDYCREREMYWELVQQYLEEENQKKVDWVLSQLTQDDFDVYAEVLGEPYDFDDYYYISIPAFLWSFAQNDPCDVFCGSDKELPPKEELLEKVMQRIQYCRFEAEELI